MHWLGVDSIKRRHAALDESGVAAVEWSVRFGMVL